MTEPVGTVAVTTTVEVCKLTIRWSRMYNINSELALVVQIGWVWEIIFCPYLPQMQLVFVHHHHTTMNRTGLGIWVKVSEGILWRYLADSLLLKETFSAALYIFPRLLLQKWSQHSCQLLINFDKGQLTDAAKPPDTGGFCLHSADFSHVRYVRSNNSFIITMQCEVGQE